MPPVVSTKTSISYNYHRRIQIYCKNISQTVSCTIKRLTIRGKLFSRSQSFFDHVFTRERETGRARASSICLSSSKIPSLQVVNIANDLARRHPRPCHRIFREDHTPDKLRNLINGTSAISADDKFVRMFQVEQARPRITDIARHIGYPTN